MYLYTYMCTRSHADARRHRTSNPAITCPMHYRYTNFAC